MMTGRVNISLSLLLLLSTLCHHVLTASLSDSSSTTEASPTISSEATEATSTISEPSTSEEILRSEAPEASTTPPSTTKSLPEGQIAWKPYSVINTNNSNHIAPINLPMQLIPGLLLPELPHQPRARWISENKKSVQLINSRPGFIYPQLPLTRGHRVKRGSGSVSGGSKQHVAVCGGEFRELYGVIQSPDYPLYYPNNKKCSYDIEVPSGYTIKLTCDRFLMQGGVNCSHDYLMVDPTGDIDYQHGTKHCGVDSPVVISNATRMRIMFRSDDLFRYQGFSCRYRALLPDGNAAPGTFGNDTAGSQSGLSSNNFLQIVQCPSNSVVSGTGDQETGSMDTAVTSGLGGAAAMYSGNWDGRCGNQNSAPGLPAANRIVGGWPTTEHQFPWMAAVLRTCETEYCHICGATIISEEWILTGAHCMEKIALEELGVLIGDHSLFTISTSQKFIRIKEKIIHPDYYMLGQQVSPLNNDIGLLRLVHPIIFTSQISPLCLPALGETGFGGSAYGSGGNQSTLDTQGLDIVGKNATVLGWGMINGAGDFADSLRGVEVEILPNEDCNQLYGIMTENMMCTSGANAQGSCTGDSGGPTIVRQSDGSWVQVGIIAFGAAAGCDLGYPSGQTLVHKFIDWIQSVTNIAFGHNMG